MVISTEWVEMSIHCQSAVGEEESPLYGCVDPRRFEGMEKDIPRVSRRCAADGILKRGISKRIAARQFLHAPYFACVENVKVVMLCLVSPGFSSVDGNEGSFGESG